MLFYSPIVGHGSLELCQERGHKNVKRGGQRPCYNFFYSEEKQMDDEG